MAKTKTVFICQQCGASQPKWMGRCPDCGEWNTLVETIVRPQKEGQSAHRAQSYQIAGAAPQPLSAVPVEKLNRIPLSMAEFNRVLGGGLVPGSLILIGGDPGVGKSTLLLQVSARLASRHGPILYISGEESIYQIKLRAERLGLREDNLFILNEINVGAILQHIEQLSPTMVIVDSIQTVYRDELTSMPGSVTQVRESAMQFQALAKGRNIPVFLIGHVTKDGTIAGPRVLEHIVDVVLYLEGERYHTYRLLRSVKNRFGATDEVGIFEMRDLGLTEVPNPSEVFLSERLPNAPGSAITVTMEGTRPLLVEIQALASTTSFGNPRRTPNGVDMNRLLLLVAVLTKRAGVRLGDQDVFVNVVGGLRVGEPAADLAIAAAIASSFRNRPLAADVALIGEVGLSGELRAVSHLETRLKEAAKLGFKRCILPKTDITRHLAPPDIRLQFTRTLPDALKLAMT
ncbi:MAG: DNA repair protein RadA [Caldilineae bacterium]|nr:MAG: DNA repair protein RadA [Caldilineae bacterium]